MGRRYCNIVYRNAVPALMLAKKEPLSELVDFYSKIPHFSLAWNWIQWTYLIFAARSIIPFFGLVILRYVNTLHTTIKLSVCSYELLIISPSSQTICSFPGAWLWPVFPSVDPSRRRSVSCYFCTTCPKTFARPAVMTFMNKWGEGVWYNPQRQETANEGTRIGETAR